MSNKHSNIKQNKNQWDNQIFLIVIGLICLTFIFIFLFIDRFNVIGQVTEQDVQKQSSNQQQNVIETVYQPPAHQSNPQSRQEQSQPTPPQKSNSIQMSFACKNLCQYDQYCMSGNKYDCIDVNKDGCLENIYISECPFDVIEKLNNYFWTFYELDVPDKTITSLAITQTEEPQIFIATSSGFYVSNSAYSDEGWNRIDLGGKPWLVFTSPKDPTTIYAITYTGNKGALGNIFTSNDLGHSWKLLLETELGIDSFTINPKNPNLLYVGLAGDEFTKPSDEGIMISDDKGRSWKFSSWNYNMNLLRPWSIEIDPTNFYIYVSAEIGSHPRPYPGDNYPPIFRSKDGGKTWHFIQQKGMWHGKIKIANGKLFFQEEGGSMYVSLDNGDNWEIKNFTGFVDFEILPNSNIIIGANVIDNPLGVFISNDGGENFKYVGLNGKEITSVELNVMETQAYFAGYGVGLWRTNLPRKLIDCKKQDERCLINNDCCNGICCSRGYLPVCKMTC